MDSRDPKAAAKLILSGLKKAGGHWGVPVIHAITAGFNGSPTEQVGEPSNAPKK